MNFQEVYFSWVSSLFTLEMGLTVSLLVTYFSSGQLLRKKHLETTSMKWHSVPDFSLSTMCNRSSLQTNILHLLRDFFFLMFTDFSDCFKLKKFLHCAKKDKKNL